ncbi:MAG: PilZ domain-containing protein [Candidatus Eremiobacteraeota bacterium]|nr:PilZ domain-containing protein [Candidatus Eremiobacteraeota bacterium]
MGTAKYGGIPDAKSVFSGTERRKASRFKMVLSLECSSPRSESVFEVKSENVSTAGLNFISHHMLIADEILTIRIALHPALLSLEVTGRVVWCDERHSAAGLHYEGGIEFVNISDKDAKKLEFFIDRYYLIGH